VTTIGDVIRQAETAMNDPRYPPTLEEKEVLALILSRAYTGTLSKVYAGTLSTVYSETVSTLSRETVKTGQD